MSIRSLFFTFLFLAQCLSLTAADFFVDQNHPNANDSNPGNESSPWATLTKANSTLAPGDSVKIKAGVYTSGFISPSRSGSLPIRYEAFDTGSVVISNQTRGIYLVGRSNIVVKNIKFSKVDQFLRIERSQRNTIDGCSFIETRSLANWEGSRIFANSSWNVITNCTFAKHGGYSGGDDFGSLIDIGDEYSTSDNTHHNLFINSAFYHGGHHVMGLFGNHNILRGCYLHNEAWKSGFGNRIVYLHGYDGVSGRNLIENNRVGFSGDPPDNDASSAISLFTRTNIVRNNFIYEGSGPGIGMGIVAEYFTSPQYNRIYNNTFWHNGWYTDVVIGAELKSGIGFAIYSGTRTIIGNAIKNNIFDRNPRAYGTYRVNLSDQVISSNWEEAGDPQFVSVPSTLDPANSSLPDFRLKQTSPCIDAGGPLIRIVSPSGTGSSFTVDDSTYFIDGWGMVPGDLIQLQNSTQRTRVISVDTRSNILTVENPISWTQNQGLSLAYQGSAPDLGAAEFSPAPQNLPPTITSSDAASAVEGQPFSFQVTASNEPISYNATGLPAGLNISTTTGLISGTPSGNGIFVATVSASNSYGSTSQSLRLSIAPAGPGIGVSPSNLQFPETGLGEVYDLEIVVRNNGAGTLTGNATAPAPFSVILGGSYSIPSGEERPVRVRYSPGAVGTHNASLTLSGGTGLTVPLSGSAFPIFQNLTFAATAGLITQPFNIANGYLNQTVETVGDPKTSGGGRAVYGFSVPFSGNFLISTSVDAADAGSDSLYINIDAEPVDPGMIWDIPLTIGFERRLVSWRGIGTVSSNEYSPKRFYLAAGNHKLIVRGREPNVKLGEIQIVAPPSPPTGLRLLD
ncbi:MAG TPA: putative Ig domain-containing protein [Verrucomicrobiae bacterium]